MICPNCGFDNLPGSEECAECLQDLTHLDRPAPHDRIEKVLMEDTVGELEPAIPFAVGPTTPVGEAVRTMIEHNVGTLLVIDDDGKIVGIFSERDVLMRVVGHHDEFAALPVSEFMTANPETVTNEDSLAFALHKMDGGDYRHLPVLQEGRPVGMISVRDMLRHVTGLFRDL